MAMDAIVAVVVDGGQAIVDIDIEAGRNKLISNVIYNFILIPLMVASSNPFQRGSRGGGGGHPWKTCRQMEKQLIMVGMFA
jgi:hypothetical protein